MVINKSGKQGKNQIQNIVRMYSMQVREQEGIQHDVCPQKDMAKNHGDRKWAIKYVRDNLIGHIRT